MKKYFPLLLAIYLASVADASLYGFQERKKEKDTGQSEEAEDYFGKWLNEDVVYIITPEERTVFEKLTTPEEKESFVLQFWYRRDPDPMTEANEFKEEHYRRIAYANELYASGKPGWKTDRGRIYIIHGPPTESESHPSGGSYRRSVSEGGGTTVAYPFEVWRYRNIEGLGDDVILEFVDKDYTGEYRLIHMPEDKDALLMVPGAGPTRAEELGLATMGQRPIFEPGGRDLYPMTQYGYRDNPFYRYEIYSKVQTPQAIRYKDLQQLVSVEIGYEELPLAVQEDFFRLNEKQALVPITVQIENQDLSFEMERNQHVARVAVYGLVTGLDNRVALEFDDDLVTSLKPEDFQRGLLRSSVYQRIVTLDHQMRYKVDIVVKDRNSGHIGVVRRALTPARFGDDRLVSSSLILANFLQVLDSVPERDEMFVLGDVKVRPSLKREFFSDSPFSVYFQLYNAGIDQSTMKPQLTVKYRLLRQGQLLQEIVDKDGSSIQFFSGRRVVVVKSFSLQGLPAGNYQLDVVVQDHLRDQAVQLIEQFRLRSD